MKPNYISEGSEWTFELIERYDQAIGDIAAGFGLDTYPNQIEIIRSEQMMDAYASAGMPIGYQHWSYGKQFLNVEQDYRRGAMGLAYEIVINSNPCIAYLMEENTMTMQALVIAHACYGHNSFFKGNYLFRSWTEADSIIDYLLFAKNYIAECEEREGVPTVERLLDSCHALMNYGVDRYKRPYPLSFEEERLAQQERAAYRQRQVNDLWRTIPTAEGFELEPALVGFPPEPEENLLYFIEKNAPNLEPWEREIVRIVRKIAQYFYPQRQTQVMNEGWATFWHYTLTNTLYDQRRVNDGFMLEFLRAHAAVIYQPAFDSPYFSGINVYTLGFAMMQDIRRICEQPTAEDKAYFPDIAGSDWLVTLKYAMRNFRDESFIEQFLSPKVIRDLALFNVLDNEHLTELQISDIHDEAGYRAIRSMLASQYNLSNREPNIQVQKVDVKGDRSLTLRHIQTHGISLHDESKEVLKHLHRLWQFDVHLETVCDGTVITHQAYPNDDG
ncbi:MAG: stage V sporulation protein R [Candidatus Azotimanducaceae bacterium]|jgi:spore cortex formation protein SpoVR/YcgB (stage V sporulation)